jgi:PAT family beta-lactamase induction signal transducer AmpG
VTLTASARRIWLQAPLGFAAGLPLLLSGQTLTAWLATENVSTKAIGAFALVSLPYNLKWLWAPFLDRFALPLLGRRRGWMLLSQVLLGFAIAALGSVDAAHNITALAVCAFVVAFLSASQDIVIDAYRTDVIPADERGRASAMYITGYRIANIVAGTGALLLADHLPWSTVYYILAGMMSLTVVATLTAPEPPELAPPRTLRAAVLLPLGEFFRRRGAVIAIAFVMLYKIGDYAAVHMVTPLLIKVLDFELTEIALLQKFIGLGATIAGAAVGGILADRIGVRRGLLWFGIIQAAANIGYVFLALIGKSYVGLASAIAIDNFCNGLGSAAFVAYLMSLCHHKFSATQYALLTSASTVLARLLTATSGWVIAAIGWAGFFGATIAIAMPAMLLWKWLPYGPGEEPEGAAAAPRQPAPPLYRAIAAVTALGFAGVAAWKFYVGDWKTGIGVTVPALAFAAYAVVSGSSAPLDEDGD